MKLGNIKLEALYLCFPSPQLYVDTDDDTLLTEALSSLKDDPNYSDYLNATVGAINRCISLFELKGMLPLKSVTVLFSKDRVTNGSFIIDMSSLANDFYKADRVITYPYGDLPHKLEFADLGNGKIQVAPINVGESYTVFYHSEGERISQATPETYELKLPRRLCEIMPYYIKSDILRVDDPTEAETARKIFNELCSDIEEGENLYSSMVRSIYKMG
ncbi:MAG: hypothetical protein IJV68_06450 [Clostridia bacterium]|nr:hypothetical protein [Clostridia bacterium]